MRPATGCCRPFLACLLVLGCVFSVRGAIAAESTALDFSLHKRGAADSGPTLLVVGGIQGDEPGGFNAASLLATHYRLERGSVWVVPNLNFPSIVKRSRGVHGDMNRKFPHADSGDPDYARVEKIKSIIVAEPVDFVFNLHDGSGYYRTEYIDRLRNPRRWGQSIIIDQETIAAPRFGALGPIAREVAEEVNQHLALADHSYRIKNTRTREGDVEMAKTLTYFAINNSKPAVGVEASKSLPTHLRAYYHLLVVETYMRRMGLVFSRSFVLTPESVKGAIDNNVTVSFYDNRMLLDMARARRRLGFVPLRKDSEIEFEASSPLVAILASGKSYRVRYGNRSVTELHPQRFEYDHSIDSIRMVVDDIEREIDVGTVVPVRDRFMVEDMPGYRVNVIGFRRKGMRNESGVDIRRRAVQRRFSIDRDGRIFRVEIYRGKKFSGMVLVRFTDGSPRAQGRVADGVS